MSKKKKATFTILKAVFINKMNRVRQFYFIFFLLIVQISVAQNLFFEECFVGGVTAAGRTSQGLLNGKFKIHWEEDFELRKAFALTYRYGRPSEKSLILNNSPFPVNMSSQFGDELSDAPEIIDHFAVHAIDITENILLIDDSISVYMEGFEGGTPIGTGYYSAMCIFLYESPSATDTTCLKIYTASQPQIDSQSYSFATPNFDSSNDVGFSIYSDRINAFDSDRSIIAINGSLLGNIGGADATNPGAPPAQAGVRGHFYYENGELFGLDDDFPNTTVEDTDGIAVVNDYLVDGDEQMVYLSALSYPASTNRANPHIAFFLTYTPDCDVLPDLGDVQREYDFCRGDTIQTSTTSAYDTFRWSEAAGLSDSTVADPFCFADSSGWYTVKMWNEGEEGCSQTIPVFIEVNEIPEPQELDIRASSCPENTGQIRAIGPAGKSPFSYWLDDVNQGGNVSDGLAPGVYDHRIRSAAGCEWDTTVALPLDPFQEASFDPFPRSGFSPLSVAFANTSTQATGYQWLIDGVPISESEDITYTFPDSGSFEVSLIAYRLEETCADTATFTLRVEPGIKVLMPNIITPNGDGRNDQLVALVQGLASCRWVIYNRWGNEVAAGEDPAPFQKIKIWNPTDDLSTGNYSVVFAAEGLAGQVEKMVFEVTVVR